MIARNPTRLVRAGPVRIGADAPISVQSMCATSTQDVDATSVQAEAMRQAGAALVAWRLRFRLLG